MSEHIIVTDSRPQYDDSPLPEPPTPVVPQTLTPLNDRVLLRRVEREQSFLVEGTASEEQSYVGQVQAIGSKVQEVQIGDLVLFSLYGAEELVQWGKEFAGLVLVAEADIRVKIL